MFGMGLGEILLVILVAIIFLGPDKLPQAMVDVARFIRKVKTTIGDARDALEEELDVKELKSDALEYKRKMEEGSKTLFDESGVKEVAETAETVKKESREVGDLFSDLKKQPVSFDKKDSSDA